MNGSSVAAPVITGRWDAVRAWRWYESKPWLVGANYIPQTAINQLEMWQSESFDPATIEKELGWACDLGFNTIRVFLHNLLHQQDPGGLFQRVDRFLDIASSRGIATMLVLLDDVWDHSPQLGPQRAPRPFIHNSGWVQAPGAEILRDVRRHEELKPYVQDVLAHFADDSRVLLWDLYNEPGNPNAGSYCSGEPKNKAALSFELLSSVFRWAREVNPSQPLTAGPFDILWVDANSAPIAHEALSPLNRLMLENSDVISFHSYRDLSHTRALYEAFARYGRPLFCTEYMARENDCTFQAVLPQFKEDWVAAYNWGFVAGKSQTYCSWTSWREAAPNEPPLWFHDILHPDGRPYDAAETEAILAIITEGRSLRRKAA